MGALEEVVLHSPWLREFSQRLLANDLTTREIRVTRTVRAREESMANGKRNGKQNVTISLDRKNIQRAKILAARRSTSISGLLAHQIEILVGEEEAYERAERQAMTLLDQGFHLGGIVRVGRDELHER
jgi:macrodomain Ter protein organizer (MatP/YcbG family)